MSEDNPLLNLSPVDGRYRKKQSDFQLIFQSLLYLQKVSKVKYFIFLFKIVNGKSLPIF